MKLQIGFDSSIYINDWLELNHWKSVDANIHLFCLFDVTVWLSQRFHFNWIGFVGRAENRDCNVKAVGRQEEEEEKKRRIKWNAVIALIQRIIIALFTVSVRYHMWCYNLAAGYV